MRTLFILLFAFIFLIGCTLLTPPKVTNVTNVSNITNITQGELEISSIELPEIIGIEINESEGEFVLPV